MNKALVILSGGQDSTTCLFWAIRNYNEIHAITFDYGQRHKIEIEAAKKVAEMAVVDSHEIIQIPHILHSTSPLITETELEQYENFQQMDEIIGSRIELTFVPMRNFLFLTIAVNRAVSLGCNHIITGICQSDNANYPDCTKKFKETFQLAANTALGCESIASLENDKYQIIAPLINLDKKGIVQLAATMTDCWQALAYTHTGYDGKYPPTDMNHANVLRAYGFEQAGLPDPLVLRAHREGLMELPSTTNYNGSGL